MSCCKALALAPGAVMLRLGMLTAVIWARVSGPASEAMRFEAV